MSTNNYFNHDNPLNRHTLGRSEQVNQIFFAIQAGFDLLPDPLDILYSSQTYVVDSGTANSYAVALPRAPSAYRLGMTIAMKVGNSNTGVSTLNVNGLGIIPIKRYNGSDLLPGDILSGMVVTLVYDGANFVMTGAHGGEVSLSMAWATSLNVVSGGLRGSRYYAQQASGSAQAAAFDAVRAEDAADQAEQLAGDLVENLPAIEAVANNIDDVVDVSNISSQITTVAGSISDVETVAANIGDVVTVAGDIAAISNVNNDLTAIGNVNTNLTAITSVSTNIADVINASNNMAAIIDAPDAADRAEAAAEDAELIMALYLGAAATDPATGREGAPLVAGNWYINTVTGFIRAYDGDDWTNGIAGAPVINYADVIDAPFDIESEDDEALSTKPFVAGVFSDVSVDMGNTGTALSLNASQGGYYTATLTGNCTITISAANAVANRATSFALRLTNDGTASRSVALAGGTFRTPGGSLGRTTTANAVDVWFFVTRDGGTNWDVHIPQKNLQTI